MEITILGNGGAINNGLPYNAFLLDATFLVEMPPDIMCSLSKNNIDFRKIESIFISHFHGDHIFGLPFFMLMSSLAASKEGHRRKLKIYGPSNVAAIALDLTAMAMGQGSKVIDWVKENVNFIEITSGKDYNIHGDYTFEFFPTNHKIPTFGFSLWGSDNQMSFAYFPDTIWDLSFTQILQLLPRIVLIDMNGLDSDNVKKHLSLGDIKRYALRITKNRTSYYATHLREPFSSDDDCIICTHQGMKIEVKD